MAGLQVPSTITGAPLLLPVCQLPPSHAHFTSSRRWLKHPSLDHTTSSRRKPASNVVIASRRVPRNKRLQESHGRCSASLVKTEVALESESATRLIEPEESATQWSFEMEASGGRVECSSRGCRPIFDEQDETSGAEGEEELASPQTRAAVYAARRVLKDLEMRPSTGFPLEFAEFLNDVWLEKAHAEKYFERALRENPRDGKALLQYAQFAWKTLAEMDKADDLFTRALEEVPNDSDAQAAYALFLWQTDA